MNRINPYPHRTMCELPQSDGAASMFTGQLRRVEGDRKTDRVWLLKSIGSRRRV